MQKRIAKTGDEVDAYSKWRHIYIYLSRPGVVKAIKRRTHKRERQEGKYEILDQMRDIDDN